MKNKNITSVIDIGSNSIVLLIVSIDDKGNITPIDEFYTITKLGRDVKANKQLSEDAIIHAVATVKEMKDIAYNEENVDDLLITASSAVRNANNRNSFLVQCHQHVGLFPQVLSRKEEAKYTFLGATHGVESERPIITIDVGGGSTEISWGNKNEMFAGYSIDIGSISLTEQFHLEKDYSIYKSISASHYIKKESSAIIKELTSWLDKRKPLIIFSGGTATTYAAMSKKEDVYDRSRIHLTPGRVKEVYAMFKRTAKLSVEARRRMPGVEKERAEEIPAGLLIMSELLKNIQYKRFTISANGLRTGILKFYATKKFKH